MPLVSSEFALFLILLIVAVCLVPRKWQLVVLLAFNLFFVISADGVLFAFMAFTAVSTYVVGRVMGWRFGKSDAALAAAPSDDREKRARIKKSAVSFNRAVLAATLVANIGMWVVLKYSNFAIGQVNALLGSAIPLPNFITPLGMSFYTFQAMGYLIDVYRRKYEADKNPIKVFVFVTLFLHVTQGPFSRYDTLGATLFERHRFSFENLCMGSRRILWGLVKKLLIGDKLGIAVDAYFNNPGEYQGLFLLFAVGLYSIQLYADFSGYMDIVCGAGRILGIKLDENFRRPFLSKSIAEYWRRWHITLGTWFRDYLLFPVSMSKFGQRLGRSARKAFGARTGKLVPTYFAMIFVWTVIGFWHGADWKYFLWGVFNFIVIVFSQQFEPSYDKIKERLHIDKHPRAWSVFQIVRTFWLVSMFRAMSRGAGVKAGFRLYRDSFTGIGASIGALSTAGLLALFPGMAAKDVAVACFFALLLVAVDLFQEYTDWEVLAAKVPWFVRGIIYALLVLSLILFAGGSTDLASGFIYAAF